MEEHVQEKSFCVGESNCKSILTGFLLPTMPDTREVIADSSALISFAAVGRLDLLDRRFDRIQIPPGVAGELSVLVARWPALQQVLSTCRPFSIMELSSEEADLARRWQSEELGCGEAESIAAGRQRGKALLMDDRAARTFAENLGVPVIGTLKVLSQCKERRVISEVRPILEEMCSRGRFFRRRLVERFLESIGEQ